MGCSNSKLDDLPAVALCRERCGFLEEAIRFRHALAEAHAAYIQSLQGVGKSLHSFVEPGFVSETPSSPRLKLPPQRKGDPDVEDSNSPLHRLSHSNSGSHLQLHSDSDDESGSLHDSDHSSPLHQAHDDYFDYADENRGGLVSRGGGGGGGFMQVNYMKNKAMPSVVYEQMPISSEKVYHMGESSSSSAYYPYPYSNVDSNPYPYNGYSNYGGGVGGYYGSSPPPAYGAMPSMFPPASSSKPPPPPPSPPRASAWDFLNLFETSGNFYNAYTPNRDPKEVREEEGIPDLEDEDYQHEVVKQIHGDKKFIEDKGGKHSKPVVEEEVKLVDNKIDASIYQTKPTAAVDDGVEYEVHVVDKKVVDKEGRSEGHENGVPFRGRADSRDIFEVVREVEFQFKKASELGDEIAKMLEVGKLPHQRKHVSSRPSKSRRAKSSSASATDKAGSVEIVFVEEMGMKSGNLSSTLKKLYLWEKKLYNEVKGEEKMRMMHDSKRHKLKRLHEQGADAQKVESAQMFINSLSTKLRIAIQVVDKISVTINNIRDEELWPQVNELIQGFTKMWKGMLEWHQSQYQAIRESRGFDHIRSGERPSDVHLRVTSQLDHELINWTSRFSSWISAQKSFVRALNNWLLKCLLYEPEETADGIVPFSPSRIGAPPIFVICNQWSQAVDRLSEKEVIDSMHLFTKSVLQIWEHDKQEVRQTMISNKDLERKVKNIDREDQKLQKKIQALDKKMILVSGDFTESEHVHADETSNGSLKAGLQCIFEALERFASDSMKAYEELLQRSAEESVKTRA